MAIDTRDERADRRQVDVVVGMDFGLISRAKGVVALRTGGKCGLDCLVGVLGQRAGHPRAAGAGRLGRGGFSAGLGRFAVCPFDGGRLELSGLFGGAARLVSSSPMRGQGADLRGLRLDLRMLRQDQGDQLITGEGDEGCVGHASP
jgi:hypothetical protein